MPMTIARGNGCAAWQRLGMVRVALMLLAALVLMLPLLAGQARAQEDDEAKEKARREMNAKSYFHGEPAYPDPVPEEKGWVRFPTPPKTKNPYFEFMPPISAEAKMKFMQSMMGYNPFGLRDMINFMAAKKKASPDLTFEEVVESLRLKGNELNMRFVGVSTPWKVIREIRGNDKYPRVEIYSFCDLETLSLVLEYMPEFIVFIPCRIAVMEDGKGSIWLVTLDWDVRWLNTSPNPNRIPKEIYERAIKIRKNMEIMMEAAANGDL